MGTYLAASRQCAAAGEPLRSWLFLRFAHGRAFYPSYQCQPRGMQMRRTPTWRSRSHLGPNLTRCRGVAALVSAADAPMHQDR